MAAARQQQKMDHNQARKPTVYFEGSVASAAKKRLAELHPAEDKRTTIYSNFSCSPIVEVSYMRAALLLKVCSIYHLIGEVTSANKIVHAFKAGFSPTFFILLSGVNKNRF